MSAAMLHVERTDDARVLKWVTHDGDLASRPSGSRDLSTARSLTRSASDGSIVAVSVVNGDVLVTASDAAAWPALVSEVHEAIAADVASHAPWLFDGLATPTVAPDVESVQATIDAAVGDLLSSHGGRIEVVGIEQGRASVRLLGACHGCAGASTTLQVAARSAVLAAHPGLVEVVELPNPHTAGTRVATFIGRRRTA
jgi:Fe-S cluster biogenesis protein NfuA